ncbi:MAG: hypothetical protein HY903_13940 [Deltaproteobacteria bacterium]|nr:hypothetical protein [Deltaproteobacteria bacterium]
MRSSIATLVFVGVATVAPPVLAQELEAELKEMSWIGFQQFQDASRVFVKTTEPVKYRVDNTRTDMVILFLENTTVPLRNNRRQLDTHFFESPVTWIQAKAIEGPSPSVRIEIRVKHKVPFKEVQNDNVLALDFERR